MLDSAKVWLTNGMEVEVAIHEIHATSSRLSIRELTALSSPQPHIYTLLLPELDLPLSYSHRLFSGTLAPFPAVGLGVFGTPKTLPSFTAPPGPNGDGIP